MFAGDRAASRPRTFGRRFVLFVALALTACDFTCAARTADARPQLLVFGGGWGPEGTQASIEAHVAALKAARPAADVLFAAPSDATRAVQFREAEPDVAGAVLGMIFDRPRDLQVGYRKVTVERDGPANRAALLARLAALDPKRPAIVFGAGHGVKASNDEPAMIDLWGPDDRVRPRDLDAVLTKKKRAAPIAFVLGQCHSGAFIDLVYEGADPAGDVARPARCVFAAVPAEREAAGCTPDVEDESAPAYLAQIADALKDRAADYDRDGRVTLVEAHAFAVINDPTIDVPVRSSEQFISGVIGAPAADAEHPLPAILAAARPFERAVLERALPPALRDKSYEDVRNILASIDERLEIVERELDDALEAKEQTRRVTLDEVLTKWPELVNPYHKRSRALLAGDAEAVVAFIVARPSYERLKKQSAVVQELDGVLFDLEKRAARIERWMRVAQNVKARQAFTKRAKADELRALRALEACEALVP